MATGDWVVGGQVDVGRYHGITAALGGVRGRLLAVAAVVVIAAFGVAFALGAATHAKTAASTRLAPAHLAPAIGTAKPAALKIAVKSPASVPTLAAAPKPKARPKPAVVASAPAATAPVLTTAATRTVTPVVATPSAPSTPVAPVTQQRTVAPAPPPPSPPARKSTGSGTITVSGSG